MSEATDFRTSWDLKTPCPQKLTCRSQGYLNGQVMQRSAKRLKETYFTLLKLLHRES